MGKKRVFAALLALAVTVGSLVLPARAAFTDTTGHWAETAITKWSEEYSIINGYEDGTFRPDNSITRGAFAGILDRFLKFQSTSPAGTFSDLSRELLGGCHPEAPRLRRLPGQQRAGPGRGHHHPPAGGDHDRTGLQHLGGERDGLLPGCGPGGGLREAVSGGDAPPWATTRIPPTGTSVPRTPSPGRRS